MLKNLLLQLSYMWGMVVLFHVNFSLMIHTVSIWLTLSLAIWRYIMIKYHSLAQSLCTVRRCKIVLLLGYGTDRNALFNLFNSKLLWFSNVKKIWVKLQTKVPPICLYTVKNFRYKISV